MFEESVIQIRTNQILCLALIRFFRFYLALMKEYLLTQAKNYFKISARLFCFYMNWFRRYLMNMALVYILGTVHNLPYFLAWKSYGELKILIWNKSVIFVCLIMNFEQMIVVKIDKWHIFCRHKIPRFSRGLFRESSF